jgi:hypothetical protein
MGISDVENSAEVSMSSFSWTCPFCSRDQIVSPAQYDKRLSEFSLKHIKHRAYGYQLVAIGCSNRNCGEVTVTMVLGAGDMKPTGYGDRFQMKEPKEFHRLRPAAQLQPQPQCVPAVLANDYYEACRIRDLSPKASATLSRRVLQGMIRDFCGISRGRLIDEITELRKRCDDGKAPQGVTVETMDAIDAVREIGNIGAHMEKDINVIVEVDPGEAQALLGLIEMLFDDWYIQREQRQQRLAQVRAIAEQKKLDKANSIADLPAEGSGVPDPTAQAMAQNFDQPRK